MIPRPAPHSILHECPTTVSGKTCGHVDGCACPQGVDRHCRLKGQLSGDCDNKKGAARKRIAKNRAKSRKTVKSATPANRVYVVEQVPPGQFKPGCYDMPPLISTPSGQSQCPIYPHESERYFPEELDRPNYY